MSVSLLHPSKAARLARRNRAKQQLLEFGHVLAMLSANAPVGFFLSDLAGRATYFNRRACKLMGLRPHAALGRGWLDAMHPDDRERLEPLRERALDSGELFRAEVRYVHADGRIIWVHAMSAAYEGESGGRFGRAGVMVDITARKQAEQDLHRANHRLQAVMDASPLAILSLDAEGRVLGWNHGAERMFGWSEAEVLGKFCPIVPAGEHAAFHDKIRRVLAGEAFHDEMRHRQHATGQPMQVVISAAPLPDENGRSVGVVAVIDDVTEREWLLRQHHRLIEDRERMARDLHDNCIQSIFAVGLNLERSRQRIEADPAGAAAVIADAVTNLNHVIGDLRSYLYGPREPATGRRDFGEEIKRAVTRAGSGAPPFTVEIDPAALSALTPDQCEELLQVAREAISNVVRHARARQGRVVLRRMGDRVQLEVADDGIGCQPTERRGLGLRHIAERSRRLRGLWRMDSAAGGSRLTVDVPAKP